MSIFILKTIKNVFNLLIFNFKFLMFFILGNNQIESIKESNIKEKENLENIKYEVSMLISENLTSDEIYKYNIFICQNGIENIIR